MTDTPQDDGLIERLRFMDCKLSGRKLEDAADVLCRQAADRIAALRAENEALRNALSNAIGTLRIEQACGAECTACEAARALLGSKPA